MSEAEHTILAGLFQRPSRTADVSQVGPEFFEDRRYLVFYCALGFVNGRGDFSVAELKGTEGLIFDQS